MKRDTSKLEMDDQGLKNPLKKLLIIIASVGIFSFTVFWPNLSKYMLISNQLVSGNAFAQTVPKQPLPNNTSSSQSLSDFSLKISDHPISEKLEKCLKIELAELEGSDTPILRLKTLKKQSLRYCCPTYDIVDFDVLDSSKTKVKFGHIDLPKEADESSITEIYLSRLGKFMKPFTVRIYCSN